VIGEERGKKRGRKEGVMELVNAGIITKEQAEKALKSK